MADPKPTAKPKRFRLRIPGATEDVPREITAYGKACQGEFALTVLPHAGKGVLVLVCKVPRGHKGGKPTMAWQSPALWKESPEGEDDHDVPRMPDVTTTEAEGAKLIATLRKAAPKAQGPTTIRGQWRGVLICSPQGPVVELRRKVSSYAELVVTSDAATGTWSWVITRNEKWFSKPARVEGSARRLLHAIRDGYGSFLDIMGPACSRRDTQRRAASDAAYAEKRPIRPARTPKRDALAWLAEADKPAGLQPRKSRGLSDADVVNAAALADPAVAALYAKTRMAAMAYARARTAKAAATWVEAAVKALGGDFHDWRGRFVRKHSARVSKGDQIVVRTQTPPVAPEGASALVALGHALGRIDKKRMPITIEFAPATGAAEAGKPKAPAKGKAKSKRNKKPVLIVWDHEQPLANITDKLAATLADAQASYINKRGGSTVQKTIEIQVSSVLPGDAGRSLHYIVGPAAGAKVEDGEPLTYRIERKHNVSDLGPLGEEWQDRDETILVRGIGVIRLDLRRLRHVWREIEPRATSGVDLSKGAHKRIYVAMRNQVVPKADAAAARSIGRVTAEQVAAVRRELDWHIERMKLEAVVQHTLGKVSVKIVETIANWQRLGKVALGDVATVLRIAVAQGVLPKGDEGRARLSDIAEQAGVRFDPAARPAIKGAPVPPAPIPAAAPVPKPKAAAPPPKPGPTGLTVLTGHTSERNAYLVADYPYGRRVRTSIRYWLETDKKRGMRLVSQTKNPKTGRWNKPKKTTYSDSGLVMYADEQGHVHASSPPWLMEDRVGFLDKFPAAPTALLRMMLALAKAERRHTERELQLANQGRTGVAINGTPVPARKGDVARLEKRLQAADRLLSRLDGELARRKAARPGAAAPAPAPAPAPVPAAARKPSRARPKSKDADDAIATAVKGQLKLALGEFFGSAA